MKRLQFLITICSCLCLPSCDVGDDPNDDENAVEETTEPSGHTSDVGDTDTGSEVDESSSSDGGTPATAECSPWMPEECGEGMKCMPYDAAPVELVWDANGCYPVVAGPDVPGDSCDVMGTAVDGVDSCDMYSYCMPADFDHLDQGGTCIAFCVGTSEAPSCENPSETCIIANDGVLNICLAMCDPVLQDCGPGQGCYLNPTDNKFFCFEQDEAAADVASGYGATCGTINFCDPGLQCGEEVNVPNCEGEYCCSEFCDLNDEAGDEQCSGVAEGQRCLPHFAPGAEPPGFEHVGLCGVPQE